jgi:hypothetical protein
MILESIKGKIGLTGNFFYFAADTIYFENFGKALLKSLKIHAAWANLHVHLYNPTQSQLVWCDDKNVSVSYESVDPLDKEFSTLCACIRFIRIAEIFDPTARIMSFDCDVIANRPISQDMFLDSTTHSRVTVKKNGRSLASAIAVGPDNFRYYYRDALLDKFLKNEIYWFLDQDILDELILDKKVDVMDFGLWTGSTCFWTWPSSKSVA